MIEWGDGFDTERFYYSMGVAPGLDAWASLHFATTLPKAADAMVAEAFADAIVIGVEMAPCIVASLTRAGIPVIDTIGTSLRFLDDVLNAWRTNRADAHAGLIKYRFDDAVAWSPTKISAPATPSLPGPQPSCSRSGRADRVPMRRFGS